MLLIVVKMTGSICGKRIFVKLSLWYIHATICACGLSGFVRLGSVANNFLSHLYTHLVCFISIDLHITSLFNCVIKFLWLRKVRLIFPSSCSPYVTRLWLCYRNWYGTISKFGLTAELHLEHHAPFAPPTTASVNWLSAGS